MLKFFRKLFSSAISSSALTANEEKIGIVDIVVSNEDVLQVSQYVTYHHGYPIVDWNALSIWCNNLANSKLEAEIWTKVERMWLLCFADILGGKFQLIESDNVMLLSSLDERVAISVREYMERTLTRILNTLEGIARVPVSGKDILIIFDDDESYYRYISYYYPDDGEFSLSGGMYIDEGCGHYVTINNDISLMETTITHEMTHGCLSHLALPLWLNEGLAVNTENRLSRFNNDGDNLQQLRIKHLNFWTEATLQEFWSGKSFLRTDDGNMLSYDLAGILVAHLAGNWGAFKDFVLSANIEDAGEAAANKYFGIGLGEFICSLLEREFSPEWTPVSTTS